MAEVALKLGARRSKQLFEQFSKQRDLKPVLHLRSVLGILMALLLVALPVALVLLGIWMVFTWKVQWMLVGGLLAYLASLTFPRPAQMPLMVLDPLQSPALHQVCQTVAEHLKTRFDAVALDWNYNAAFGRYTLHRKAVMTLGLPLMANLNPQEKLAIMAHEMAHQAHRDFTRSFLFHWATHILFLLTYPLAAAWMEAPFHAYYLIMATFLFEESQRAEYYADDVAASIAGTEATMSALRKLHHGVVYVRFLEHNIRSRNNWDIFQAFAEHVTHIPEREGERLRRAEQQESLRLQSTHPPTLYRLKRLQAFDKPALGLVREDTLMQMEQELQACHPEVQAALMSLYRDVVY